MSAEPSRATSAPSSLAAAERAVAAHAANFRGEGSDSNRGKLVDALMALAAEAFHAGDDGTAAAALSEAEATFPAELPTEMPWPARVVNLNRAKGGLAQKQGRAKDAVAAFQTALAALPADAAGDRDARAARLQLLVRMARSQLALGEGAETASNMAECEKIIGELGGAIPSRALDTVRAAVLGNLGSALALLGKHGEAEEKFSASLGLIERLGGPDLEELKQQVRHRWASALRASGRAAEADALLAGSAPQPHAHHAAYECGHNHAHDKDHAAGHRQHG